MLTSRQFTKAIASLLAFLAALTFSQEARGTTFNVADGDVAGLIAAINAANSNPGPDTINLAQGGNYTLTYIAGPDSFHGPTGLPIVQGFSETQRESLTINGNGSTIRRSDAPGIPDFRIFHALYANVILDSIVIKGGRGYGSRCGGGGLYLNVSNTVIRNSTITDNFGMEGGGICNNNASTLTIENSTISHNTGPGGEILNHAASLSISNTTIYDDQADAYRSDSIVDAFSSPGSIVIKNSIVVSPTGGFGISCYAFTPVSLGHNIFSDSTCGQNIAGGDLIVPNLTLGPLSNNGGSTSTHPLVSGSPALDAIPVSDCTNVAGTPILFDQRGISRPQGARCDIGAYELLSVDGPASYTDRAAWAAAHCASATTNTIDFSHKDDNTPITNPNSDTFFDNLSLSGVIFHQVRSYYNALIYTGPTGVIKVDLPSNTFSFGADLAAFYSTPGTYTITLSTGQTYHITSDGRHWTSGIFDFFGVTSSTPIEWVTFSYDQDFLIIDNFTVVTACDSTAPVIMPTVTGTLGNNGWYTSDVDVSWSVNDPESAVSASMGCETTSVTADTSGITFTCSATSGGGSSNQSVTIKRDTTAPSVLCGSADGAWHASDVSIACTGSDNVSQLANAGDASFSLTTSVPAGTETANASTGSRNVFDNAGNFATAGPVSGNNVDKKAPTISIPTPSANAVFLLNQSVASSYTCSDGGSGVASCAGPLANGNNIDTASAGSKAFTVNATDQVGNTATPQSVSYSVGYGFVAFYDQTKVHKSGSTVPIKIQIVDANGVNYSSASLLAQAMSVVLVSANASGTPEDAGNSNPDLNFRYDASLGGYIFNLKTTGYAAGTYELHFVVAGDARDQVLQFRIRP
jgi:hypothetical protein